MSFISSRKLVALGGGRGQVLRLKGSPGGRWTWVSTEMKPRGGRVVVVEALMVGSQI